MSGNEYQKLALRTSKQDSNKDEMMAECALGLNGEAGEVADLIKKHLYHGHEIFSEHLAKELGDCMWYIAVLADTFGYPLDVIMEMNITKLKNRYPDGFDSEKSINRKEDDI